jgi:hypothetical protein
LKGKEKRKDKKWAKKEENKLSKRCQKVVIVNGLLAIA